VVQFYDRFDVLSNNQCGFRKNRNTSAATINLICKLQKAGDGKKILSAIFLDISKAFDTVHHEILLQKLYNSGLRGKAHNLLKDYLSNRKQVVKIGQTSSAPERVKYSVPQE
jgi:hypothetical protein